MLCPRCEGAGSPLEQGFVCKLCNTCFFEREWPIHADHLLEPASTDTRLIVRRRTRRDIGRSMVVAGCFVLAGFGVIGVASDGLDTLDGIALGLSIAVGLFNAFFFVRDAFGRVILSLAPEELRVRQHPVLLSAPLAIPKLDIRSIRVCAPVDDDYRTGLYDLVVESKRGPERIVEGVQDAGALVALAELIGRRIGVKCETRTRRAGSQQAPDFARGA